MAKDTKTEGQPGPSSTLAERVTYAMMRRQLSQMDVENTARLSRGYVSRVARGERARLSPELMGRLAGALAVSYTWLATGHGDMDDVEGGAPVSSRPSRSSSVRVPSLDAAIAYHRGKWSAPTVAAARAMAEEPGAEELKPPEWAEVLDQIEAALAKVKVRTRG